MLVSFPLQYSGSFIDTHLHEIFIIMKHKGYNRMIFLKDVIFEHQHFRVTGEKPDETYKNRERFGDDKIFFTMVKQRIESAGTIVNFIERGYCGKFNRNFETTISGAFFTYLFSRHLPLVPRLKMLTYLLARFLYAKTVN